MNRSRPHNRSLGFTLLEMLVVISILGVVTALGASAFVSVTASWNAQKRITDLDAQAIQALDSIRADLTNTLSEELSAVGLRGLSRERRDESTFPAAVYPDDQLTFPIQSMDPTQSLAVPAKVGYRVDRSSGQGILVRTLGPLDQGFPSSNTQQVIPRAYVLGFSLEYLTAHDGDDGLWTPQWDQNRLPDAVRVTLVLQDPDRPEQIQITRTGVVPIRVR